MRIIVDRDVPMRARDGVPLATDVYRPAEGGPWPTLVSRMPYDKDAAPAVLNATGFDLLRAVAAGYAVVAQDTRGRSGSGGTFVPFVHEAADGADVVEWAAAQPWSTGAVGMVGGSYLGLTQWTAASQAPKSLRAIAPVVSTSHIYEHWTHQGGALQLGFLLWWSLSVLGPGKAGRDLRLSAPHAADRLRAITAAADSFDDLVARLPVADVPELRDLVPYYADWLAHTERDEYWESIAPQAMHRRIGVPALSVGGWFDLFLPGTIASYRSMREQGDGDAARRLQRLVIGPWTHGNLTGVHHESNFGLGAGLQSGIDSTGLQLRWFDWHLKGEQRPFDPDRPVSLFLMGENRWVDAADWPVPGAESQSWYLHSGGRANTADGDGSLDRSSPTSDEPSDVYVYDPRHPTPTVGGASFLPGLQIGINAGPYDQRVVEQRDDVLCYTSEPLTSPLTVVGDVVLHVHVSSSAPDTDVTAKLVDVWPDGRAMSVVDGILRLRYRDGSQSVAPPMDPARTYELAIAVGPTASVFAAGHRLRLEISSSNFPRFDRNPNVGAAADPAAATRPARNRVHHSPALSSRLILPVVDL